MMPGVTHFPVPSMTTAPVGTVTLAPIAAITPSRSRIAPPSMRWPVPVRIVAFRMTVGSDGNGR